MEGIVKCAKCGADGSIPPLESYDWANIQRAKERRRLQIACDVCAGKGLRVRIVQSKL